MQKKYSVQIDLYHSHIRNTTINYIVADMKTMPLYIQLLDKGAPFNIPDGAIIEMNFETSSGLRFPRLGTVQNHEQGKIFYEIDPADIAIAGNVTVSITVVGPGRLTWQGFQFKVHRNLSDNQTEPPEVLGPWKNAIEEKLSGHEERITTLESGSPADLTDIENRLAEALDLIAALQAEATAKWILLNDVDNRTRSLENRITALE